MSLAVSVTPFLRASCWRIFCRTRLSSALLAAINCIRACHSAWVIGSPLTVATMGPAEVETGATVEELLVGAGLRVRLTGVTRELAVPRGPAPSHAVAPPPAQRGD